MKKFWMETLDENGNQLVFDYDEICTVQWLNKDRLHVAVVGLKSGWRTTAHFTFDEWRLFVNNVHRAKAVQ